jgi:hypothetical protein
MKTLTLIIVGLILIQPPSAMAGDEEDVAAVLKKLWVDISNKKINTSTISSNGVWQAKSSGGLWDLLTPNEVITMINDSPNNLKFRPHHIEVGIVGKNKDVAHVNYYLVGTIAGPDGKIITKDYRTRASEVMVKKDNTWVTVSSHYSPLYGGMGVILD